MYLDPPYLHSSRVDTDAYDREMKIGDHGDLLELLFESDSKFLLSGYENKIYNKLEKEGWEKLKLGEFTKASSDYSDKGEEYIWFNYKMGL